MCRSLYVRHRKGTQKPYLILIESSSCPSSSCSQDPLIRLAWYATITKTETGRYVIILLGHMSTFGSALISEILFSCKKGSWWFCSTLISRERLSLKKRHTRSPIFSVNRLSTNCTVRSRCTRVRANRIRRKCKIKTCCFFAALIQHICCFHWIYIELSLQI